MKKVITWLLLVLVLGSLWWYAQNSSISDYTDQVFGGTDLFGYKDGNQVNVKDISENTITFTSPALKNESNEQITNYDVLFGINTLGKIVDDTTLFDTLKTKKVVYTGAEAEFSFALTVEDNALQPENIYYAYVLPKDVGEMPGAVSREFCFNLQYKVHGIGNECITKVETAKETETTKKAEEAVHNAAGADMKLANVTHTVDGKTHLITWTAIEWSDKIEFFLLNESATDDNNTQLEKLGTADMFDQKFVFDYDGEHSTTLSIRPDNGWKEKNITLNFTPPVKPETPKVKTQPKKPQPTIAVVPQTGAKENMLIILIIAILGFVLYKAMRRSH